MHKTFLTLVALVAFHTLLGLLWCTKIILHVMNVLSVEKHFSWLGFKGNYQ